MEKNLVIKCIKWRAPENGNTWTKRAQTCKGNDVSKLNVYAVGFSILPFSLHNQLFTNLVWHMQHFISSASNFISFFSLSYTRKLLLFCYYIIRVIFLLSSSLKSFIPSLCLPIVALPSNQHTFRFISQFGCIFVCFYVFLRLSFQKVQEIKILGFCCE